MQIVLITGLSGSGKSVALHTLEDAGFYTVDRLPVAMLLQLLQLLEQQGYRRVAVALDMRFEQDIHNLTARKTELVEKYPDTRAIYLDTRDDVLVTRFSETRRSHPLTRDGLSLSEAIARERDLLAPIAERAHRIDTSDLAPNTLRDWIKAFIRIESHEGMTLMFESFGFKRGIPLDADLVFDVRCLPNPYWDKRLRPLTGRDQPVIDFLQKAPEVARMIEDIRHFIAEWLPAYTRGSRSYLTVAIGCTGGQHRSVYIAEQLAARFRGEINTIVRHRRAPPPDGQ